MQLQVGDIRLELDPLRGGRVSRLRLGEVDLLVDESAHASNWGSTYWTSPQGDWGWPPVPAIDHEPYAVASEGSTIILTSGPAFAGTKQLVVTKRFSPDWAAQAVDVEYVVRNVSQEAFSIASWEISRVPPDGLSFFRTGAREYTEMSPHGELPVTKQGGVTWFDHRRFPAGRGAKLNADSAGRWLAHVVRCPDGPDVLFLKRFEAVALDRQAPGEGVVELYADEARSYVEIENQGPYESIAPQGSSLYRVKWILRQLPTDVDVAIGSTKLLDFVETLAEAW